MNGMGLVFLAAHEPTIISATIEPPNRTLGKVVAALLIDSCSQLVAQSSKLDYVFLHIWRAASETVSSVGTVTSSSGGENGIGTCIAPMRFTGASKS